MSPRPWVVVGGALAVGIGMGAAAATGLSGEARKHEVVGPGIVLTAEPSDDPSPTSFDGRSPAAVGTAPEASAGRATGGSQPQSTPTPVDPAPQPDQPGPAPAPPPAPQPVTDAESDDSATEWSADSAD